MKYKLYKEVDDTLSPQQQVLYNRGMAVEDQQIWIHAGTESLYSWKDFGPIMEQSAEIVKRHIDNDDDILVVVDCD